MAALWNQLKGLIQTYSDDDLQELPAAEIEMLKNLVAEINQAIHSELEQHFMQEDPVEYILKMQQQLTYLADSITDFDREGSHGLPSGDFFTCLLETFYDLLDHLRIYFPDNFDFNARLPLHFSELRQPMMRQRIDGLLERLAAAKVETQLIALIAEFFEATNHTEGFCIQTWQQWCFQRKMLTVLTNLPFDGQQKDLELEILKTMIAMDFNSIQLYGYFIRYAERNTSVDSSFPEQQEQLIYLLKVIRQVRSEDGQRFDPQGPSFKEAVIESLEAELAYLEQREKLYLRSLGQPESGSPSSFYFKVVLTLAELMFFFRVAIEVGWLTTRFNTYLYEFISKHIQTQRAENISKKSMRNHFNSKPFPDKVVREVRLWLDKMINHIDLYYKL